MAKYNQIWMLGLLGVALIAMILLAAGLPGLEFLPGQPFPFRAFFRQWLMRPTPAAVSPMPLAGPVRVLILIFVWVLLPITIVSLLVSRAMRRKALRQLLIWSAWGLFIYLVIQAIIAANQLGVQAADADRVPRDLSGERLLAFPEFITDPPQWLVITISLLLAALLVGGIWFARQRFHQRASPLELLASEAQEALDELDAGGDFRDIVIRCYLEMSRVLSQQHGVWRHRNMTAREFEDYLAATGLRDEHIRQLTRLFEAVRYGAKRPGHREEQEAVACLQAIVQAHGRSA